MFHPTNISTYSICVKENLKVCYRRSPPYGNLHSNNMLVCKDGSDDQIFFYSLLSAMPRTNIYSTRF